VTALDDADLQNLGQFKLWSCVTGPDASVNDARLYFFTHKQRPYDDIPPQSAPKLHSNHATSTRHKKSS